MLELLSASLTQKVRNYHSLAAEKMLVRLRASVGGRSAAAWCNERALPSSVA